MTRAFPSPSSAPAPTRHEVAAGPLDITVASSDAPLLEVIQRSLAVYDHTWTLSPKRTVELSCELTTSPLGEPARGTYIAAARMLVDTTASGMCATTEHGASLVGDFDDDGEHWLMRVPTAVSERGLSWEIEDLLSLVLTTGWRRHGWVPLHAAAVTDGRRGVIVCASSGGGKTTFMLAMVRAGWQALGDDKLLLRTQGTQPVIGALKHTLNIDPAVAAWFPEIGDLRGLPEYSAWTPKRRVALDALWPHATAAAMRPTTIVSLERNADVVELALETMTAGATVATLLRQTVIPNDPDQARWITRELAACAGQAAGFRLIVGNDAYVTPGAMAGVVRRFQ